MYARLQVLCAYICTHIHTHTQVKAGDVARDSEWKWLPLGAPRGDIPRMAAPMGIAEYPPPPQKIGEQGLPRTLIKEKEVMMCFTHTHTHTLSHSYTHTHMFTGRSWSCVTHLRRRDLFWARCPRWWRGRVARSGIRSMYCFWLR